MNATNIVTLLGMLLAVVSAWGVARRNWNVMLLVTVVLATAMIAGVFGLLANSGISWRDVLDGSADKQAVQDAAFGAIFYLAPWVGVGLLALTQLGKLEARHAATNGRNGGA